MVCLAASVVREGLNDLAIANPPMPALRDHPLEFPTQRHEALDAPINLSEVVSRDAVHLMA